jgi:hypothetical protein
MPDKLVAFALSVKTTTFLTTSINVSEVFVVDTFSVIRYVTPPYLTQFCPKEVTATKRAVIINIIFFITLNL